MFQAVILVHGILQHRIADAGRSSLLLIRVRPVPDSQLKSRIVGSQIGPVSRFLIIVNPVLLVCIIHRRGCQQEICLEGQPVSQQTSLIRDLQPGLLLIIVIGRSLHGIPSLLRYGCGPENTYLPAYIHIRLLIAVMIESFFRKSHALQLRRIIAVPRKVLKDHLVAVYVLVFSQHESTLLFLLAGVTDGNMPKAGMFFLAFL